MSVLLLRLEGPLQAWSTQHDIKERQTGWEPSKSGVIGLLCAALGKPRSEDHLDNQGKPTLAELANLRMGVRVDRQGTPLRDFHTAGKDGFLRASGGAPEQDNVVLTTRWYLADAAFLVALESNSNELLALLHLHLQHPIWTLYLGRKACVPSAPIYLKEKGLQPDTTLDAALAEFPWLGRRIDQRKRPETLRIVRDALPNERGDQTRDDIPLAYDGFRWRYLARSVITTSTRTPAQRYNELEVT